MGGPPLTHDTHLDGVQVEVLGVGHDRGGRHVRVQEEDEVVSLHAGELGRRHGCVGGEVWVIWGDMSDLSGTGDMR